MISPNTSFTFHNNFLTSDLRGTFRTQTTNNDNLILTRSPIFVISNLFALFPFSRGEPLRIHYVSLLFGCFAIIIICSFCFLQIEIIRKTEHSSTNFLLYIGYSLMNTFFSIVCIGSPVISRRSKTRILKGFFKVDQIIQTLQPNYKFEESSKRQYLQIMFTIVVTSSFAFIYYKALSENRFPTFTYIEFYILPTTLWIIFQIDYLQVRMQKRFEFVNSYFGMFLKEKVWITDHKSLTNGFKAESGIDIYRLNQLNFIHFTLYRIISEVNRAYSLQFLLMVPRIIFFSVLPVHYNIVSALVSVSKETNGPQLWTHIFTTSYLTLLSGPIIYSVSVVSKTVNIAKKFQLFIHDLIDEDQETHVEYELLVDSIQLLHRKTEFSVNKFFNMTPSLTTAMLELIITYVIILLQFQDTLSSISPIRLLIRPITYNNLSLATDEIQATTLKSSKN